MTLAVLALTACDSHAAPTATTTTGVKVPEYDVGVFVDPAARPLLVASISSQLAENPALTTCRYFDRKQSYEYEYNLLKSKGLHNALHALSLETTPSVFVCALKNPGDNTTLQQALEKVHGVFDVTTGSASNYPSGKS